VKAPLENLIKEIQADIRWFLIIETIVPGSLIVLGNL